MIDPVSVALKFGFLAVLYLFLLWVSRSALKDLRRGAFGGGRAPVGADATGMRSASSIAPLDGDLDVAPRQHLAQERADADADREHDQKQRRDLLVAVQHLLRERGELGQEGGADSPTVALAADDSPVWTRVWGGDSVDCRIVVACTDEPGLERRGRQVDALVKH